MSESIVAAENSWVKKQFLPGAAELVIHFSSRNTPETKFNRFSQEGDETRSHLFVNSATKNWYTTGITGIGDLQTSVGWLSQQVKKAGVSRVYTVGSSMGAFAAALFGGALSAEAVCCFGPEIILDVPTGFSREDKHVWTPLSHEHFGRAKKLFIIAGTACLSDVIVARHHLAAAEILLVPDVGHGTAKHLKDADALPTVLQAAFSPNRRPGTVSVWGADPIDQQKWEAWFRSVPDDMNIKPDTVSKYWNDIIPKLPGSEITAIRHRIQKTGSADVLHAFEEVVLGGNPGNHEARYGLAVQLQAHGNYTRAKQHLLALEQDSYRPSDVTYYLAKNSQLAGEARSALYYYAKLIHDFPAVPQANLAMARIEKGDLIKKASDEIASLVGSGIQTDASL